MTAWFIGFVALNVATLVFGLWIEEATKDSTPPSVDGIAGPKTTNSTQRENQ